MCREPQKSGEVMEMRAAPVADGLACLSSAHVTHRTKCFGRMSWMKPFSVLIASRVQMLIWWLKTSCHQRTLSCSTTSHSLEVSPYPEIHFSAVVREFPRLLLWCIRCHRLICLNVLFSPRSELVWEIGPPQWWLRVSVPAGPTDQPPLPQVHLCLPWWHASGRRHEKLPAR